MYVNTVNHKDINLRTRQKHRLEIGSWEAMSLKSTQRQHEAQNASNMKPKKAYHDAGKTKSKF